MRRASLTALILAGSAGIPATFAQDLSDSVLSATISQSLEADSNYDLDDESPGTSTFADTRLGLDYVRETSTQRLGLGFNTGLRALWKAEEDFEFTLASPTGARLDYDVEGANSLFDTTVRYRQRLTDFSTGIDDFVNDDDDFLPDDLEDVAEDDTRERRVDADIGFEYGTNDPSTYGLRLSATDISYDADAPDLTPRRSAEADGYWELRLNPVLSAAVLGSYYQYEAENNSETEIDVTEADAGFVYEPSDDLRVRAGIGYAVRNEEQLQGGERVTEQDKGPTLRGDFSYALPDFTLTGNGRLTSAAPETRFSFNLRGNYALPRGRLDGRVFNRYTGTTNTGDESRISGVGLGYEHDINNVSSFGLNVSLAYQENLEDDDDPDITRTTFTANYSYDLTPAVAAEVGYRFRSREEDPTDANSHRVYLVIGRTFSTGL
jgi:hypothetical protein